MRLTAILIACIFGLTVFSALFVAFQGSTHQSSMHSGSHSSMPAAACLSVCLAALPDVSPPAVAAALVIFFVASVLVFVERRQAFVFRTPRFLIPVPLGNFVGTTLLRE